MKICQFFFSSLSCRFLNILEISRAAKFVAVATTISFRLSRQIRIFFIRKIFSESGNLINLQRATSSRQCFINIRRFLRLEMILLNFSLFLSLESANLESNIFVFHFYFYGLLFSSLSSSQNESPPRSTNPYLISVFRF